jgi:hypothetical protein
MHLDGPIIDERTPKNILFHFIESVGVPLHLFEQYPSVAASLVSLGAPGDQFKTPLCRDGGLRWHLIEIEIGPAGPVYFASPIEILGHHSRED